MPEILTESFCERCGTRYTFESAVPTKTKKLGRFKTLSKGLKNYVLSDDTSLDEAMAAARSDDEREITAQQLDAFHSTFNFCMNCRQYTCANCWNQAEGQCLTCSPHLGHEVLPAPFPDLVGSSQPEALQFESSAWPTMDLPVGAESDVAATNGTADAEFDLAERLAKLSRTGAKPETVEAIAEPQAAEPEPVEVAAIEMAAELEPEPVVEGIVEPAAAAEPEPIAPIAAETVEAVAAEPDVPVEAASSDPDLRAATAARRTSDLLAKFRPGQNIDAELEAFEAALAMDERVEAERVAEAVTAAPPETPAEPEAVVVEAEAIESAPEPEPESVAAAAELVAAEPAPEIPAAPEPEPVRADIVEQPTWRIVAPEAAEPVTNGHAPSDESLPAAATSTPTAPPAPRSEPQWPTSPQWPLPAQEVSVLASRLTSASKATEALWAASVRDVVSPPAGTPAGGVQPCSNCGLSLSANARFCRRCGSRQGE
jgi:hypothetical protein